jgi:hypothetical protein
MARASLRVSVVRSIVRKTPLAVLCVVICWFVTGNERDGVASSKMPTLSHDDSASDHGAILLRAKAILFSILSLSLSLFIYLSLFSLSFSLSLSLSLSLSEKILSQEEKGERREQRERRERKREKEREREKKREKERERERMATSEDNIDLVQWVLQVLAKFPNAASYILNISSKVQAYLASMSPETRASLMANLAWLWNLALSFFRFLIRLSLLSLLSHPLSFSDLCLFSLYLFSYLSSFS